MSPTLQINPALWFDNNAEEAVDFYSSIFPSSEVTSRSYYTAAGEEEHKMTGRIMSMSFTLNGQPFIAINGGPGINFGSAVHFTVVCADQEEVDYYWEKLGAGGEHARCGWLKDKFGVSWRVIPKQLEVMQSNGTQDQRFRVAVAKSKMEKFVVDGLLAAFKGE